MPKGKHAAALFEVINRDKNFEGKVGMSGALRTPKWWFKGREKAAEKRTPADISASSPSPESSLAPRIPQADSVHIPSNGGMDVAIDPDRQQIAFRLSYTTAAIGAFALIVIVAMAYIVGQKISRGPASAEAGQSTSDIRSGPVTPGVLDVNGNDAGNGGVEPMVVPVTPETRVNPAQPTVQPPANNPAPPSTLVVQGGPRQNGLNYVVIQGYPERKDAEEAVDVLAKSGITATIETKLRGMRPDWFIVVGTDGFARISAVEYNNYVARIEKASAAAYKNKRSFKAFNPMPYKWDRAR